MEKIDFLKEHQLLLQKANKEQQFLLHCLQGSFLNPQEKLNWEYFAKQVIEHNVAGVLFNYFSKNENIVPIDVLDTFKNIYEKNIMRHILWANEATNITNALSENGINTVLLKGIGLADTIYPHPWLRSFSDIDFLVPQDKLLKVKDILIDLGYDLIYTDSLKWLLKNNLALSFINKKNKIYLEIHTDIVNNKWYAESTNIDMDAIWQNVISKEINGKKVFLLSPEDNILYLSIHLAVAHGFHGLIWFYDINEFINFYKNKINWDILFERAEKFNIVKPVYLTLLYTAIVFQNEICIKNLEHFRSFKISRFENQLWVGNILNNNKYAHFFFWLMPNSRTEQFKLSLKMFFARREHSIVKSGIYTLMLSTKTIIALLNNYFPSPRRRD